MARLRLFANLREAAGTPQADFPGATVAEVLDAAKTAYGEDFSRGVAIAKVWVNGNPATADDQVSEQDEVALIPPVSGGTTASRVGDGSGAILVVALLLALVISNLISDNTTIFVFVVVGTALAWLWDTTDVLRLRSISVNPIPLMIGATATANGAYTWGAAGFAGGIAVAIMVTLTWSVLDPSTTFHTSRGGGNVPGAWRIAGNGCAHHDPPLLDTYGHCRHCGGGIGRICGLGRTTVRWRGRRSRPQPWNGSRRGHRRTDQWTRRGDAIDHHNGPGGSRQRCRADRRSGIWITTSNRVGSSHRPGTRPAHNV